MRSTQLVAIREGAWSAGNVVTHAALHEVCFVRVPEENECRAVVDRARVAGDLPAGSQEFLNGDVLFGGHGQSGR